MENPRILGAPRAAIWKGAVGGAVFATLVTGGLFAIGVFFIEDVRDAGYSELYFFVSLLVSLPSICVLHAFGWTYGEGAGWLFDLFTLLVNAALGGLLGAPAGWALSGLAKHIRKAFRHE